MNYCDADTGAVMSWADVVARANAAHPNKTVSISRTSNAQALAVYGVSVVQDTARPELQPWQALDEGPLEKDGSVWRTTWVVVNPTVTEALEIRKAAIEQQRDLLRNDPNATVTLNDGRVFQTDPVSRDLMNQAKSNADLNGGFSVDAIWRGADNVNYPRTTALFAEISAKEEERQQPFWYLSWVLKGEIETIAASELLTDDEKVTAIMSQTWATPAEL